MRTRFALLAVACGLASLPAMAQAPKKYDGPRPPKADVPYLLHARNLVETDIGEAKEEKIKNDLRYTLPGTTAKARTPLMEPMFLLQTEKLIPEKITCYKMEVKNGLRELIIPTKPKRDAARPRRLTVTQVADKLFKIELTEALDNGEYVLTPEGSNQSFGFSVY